MTSLVPDSPKGTKGTGLEPRGALLFHGKILKKERKRGKKRGKERKEKGKINKKGSERKRKLDARS